MENDRFQQEFVEMGLLLQKLWRECNHSKTIFESYLARLHPPIHYDEAVNVMNALQTWRRKHHREQQP